MRYREKEVIDEKIELVRFLGQGGCGEVWLGRNLILEHDVAIKLFKDFGLGRFQKYAELGAVDSQEMFKRDARNHFRLKGLDNIAEFYDVGLDGNLIYIVQEFVDGPNLREYFELGKGNLTERLMEISKGLAGAHERGIVHNDLKPENVMVSGEGVKLVDFGLSFLGEQDTMSGSLPYISPEAIERRGGFGSDVWSLGVIGYEQLTSKLPFRSSIEDWRGLGGVKRREQEEDLKFRINNFEPERVDGDLGKIVMNCLKKNPEGRYENGFEVWKELDGLVNKRVSWVVDKYKDSKDMKEMAGELLESLFRNKIDRWNFLEDKFPYGVRNDMDEWMTTIGLRWIGGFLPAIYWLGGELIDERYKELAIKRSDHLTNLIEGELSKNLNNAQIQALSSNAYLALTKGHEITGNKKYKDISLKLAYLICSRFKDGFFSGSADEKRENRLFTSTMYGCLPLLCWASEFSNEFFDFIKYFSNSINQYNVREDSSVCEITEIKNGKVVNEENQLGFGEEPRHSRTQTNAIYGFIEAHKATKENFFLETAEKLADYFIENLGDDLVPVYDFGDPNQELPKDSSAAALGALTLFKLFEVHPDKINAKKYWEIGEKIIISLVNNYLNFDEGHQGILNGACGNYSRDLFVGGSLIYGDYYLLENLKKLKN